MNTKLFSDSDIKKNALYGSVMSRINDLFVKCNQPTHIQHGKPENTTTGSYKDPYWDAGSIGEWDGKEEAVAEYANSALEEVFDGLGLYGNGGISRYYSTPEWDEFANQAWEIIENYHQQGAYETLCDSAIAQIEGV